MNFFLNRESFFRNQISCKSLNVYRHEYKNSIIYFNMKRVILLHNPSFLKKKCCPIFGCILLVICEITLTLRHDAIFFRKNKQHSTAIEDKKKNSSPPLHFDGETFLKKKTLTLKEVWQMVVFGKRKMIMHILTYCWNSWGQHLVMCLSIPRVSAAADAARLHYFFFWKLLKYVSTIREFLGGHWL